MKPIKLLCIAILGMIVGSVYSLPPARPVAGTNILDFDTIANIGDNIPAMFQPKIYEPADYNVAGPNNLRYVYFTVFNPGEAAVCNPVQTDNNIYFPADGSQPTTPEAVAWSCANVENNAITDWYMKMFGVIPYKNDGTSEDDYIKAGYDKHNTTCRIIDTSSLLPDDEEEKLPKQYPSKSNAFKENFKKIASTSVGRVLLYRLLIEIRRHTNVSEKSGCLEASIDDQISINHRNDCRHLTISWRSSGNSFNFITKTINFGVQFPTKKTTTISPIENENYHEIILYSRSDDVGLFHEMVHWYHSLRHTGRYILERNADNGQIKIDGTTEVSNTRIDIGNYYWSQETRDKWKFSAMPWIVKKDESSFAVGFEEVRTILGSATSVANYINGDDISENLYRLCNQQPLRFGHSSSPFYEDKNLVDKVKLVCSDSMQQYLHNNTHAHIVDNPQQEDYPKQENRPKFKYTSTVLKSGIGYCKYPHIDIKSIEP